MRETLNEFGAVGTFVFAALALIMWDSGGSMGHMLAGVFGGLAVLSAVTWLLTRKRKLPIQTGHIIGIVSREPPSDDAPVSFDNPGTF
jgi:hypothetical protein